LRTLLAAVLGVVALVVVSSASATPAATTAIKAAQREYLRGTLLEHRGDLAGAFESYEAALAADPASAYICHEAAELALEIGSLDKALALAQRLLKMDGQSAKAHVLMGRVLWARDEASGAQAAFEEALKIDPQSAETILSLSGLLAEREPDKARRLLLQLIEKDPDEAGEAYYQIAKMDYDAGRLDSAISRLKSGIAVEPDSLPLRYALAQAYETRASTDAALSEYLEILKLDPGNVALIDHIGDIYFLKGEITEARARFMAARQLQPSDAFSSQWLATDAERQGDWAGAAEYLGSSSALADDPSLNLRLSYYHSQAGRLGDAVRTLEGAHQRWPANDQIAYFLALGYDDSKQAEKSVGLLRQVLEVKPDFREARYQLGAILEKLNRFDEAEKEFRRLLADKPDDAAVLNYLGYSLVDRGLKLQEAQALIEEAVRLVPTNAAYLDSLGWALFKQGRSTEAVAGLQRAAARGPEDEMIWDHLGDAYSQAGDAASAWLAWKRCVFLGGSRASLRKAAQAQRRFNAEELGDLYLEYLAQVHGRVAKLSSVCRVEGEVLGRRFAYDGLLSFQRPGELSLDILGPLFVPLFRVHLGVEGLAMDAIRIEGVDPEIVRQAVESLLSALREYLCGDLFALKPAAYRKGWWSQGWLEAGGRRLDLDSQGQRLAGMQLPAIKGKIIVDDFDKVRGHAIFRKFTLAGLGYALTIRLGQFKVDFVGGGVR